MEKIENDINVFHCLTSFKFEDSDTNKSFTMLQYLTREIFYMINDDEEDNRIMGYTILKKVVESSYGAKLVVSSRIIPTLVENLENESKKTQFLILQGLYYCAMVDRWEIINAGIIPNLKIFLEDNDSKLQLEALKILKELCFEAKTRNLIFDLGIVQNVISLLSHTDDRLKEEALSIILLISHKSPGRLIMSSKDVCAEIASFLTHENREVKTKSAKVLSMLCRLPIGRSALLPFTKKILPLMMNDKFPDIRRAAKKTMSYVIGLNLD